MMLRPGWLLWADWCVATGRSPQAVTEEALALFGAQVGGDHRGDIRATLRAAGVPWPVEEAPRDPWRAVEPGLAGLAESLRRCPLAGWPVGYRGRRDAWLLVLTRGIRLCRREALAVSAADVAATGDGLTVAGMPVARGEDPATCRECTVVRWFRAVAEERRRGRSAVREMLTRARTHEGHVCGHLPGVPPDAVLSPAIDQHGWVSDWRPMSPRALTEVLALRCASDPAPEPASVEHRARAAPVHPFDETTFERLDAACRRADQVNARVAALLGDTEAMLGTHPLQTRHGTESRRVGATADARGAESAQLQENCADSTYRPGKTAPTRL